MSKFLVPTSFKHGSLGRKNSKRIRVKVNINSRASPFQCFHECFPIVARTQVLVVLSSITLYQYVDVPVSIEENEMPVSINNIANIYDTNYLTYTRAAIVKERNRLH